MDADIVSRAVPIFCLIVPPHCLRDGFMPSGQLVAHPRLRAGRWQKPGQLALSKAASPLRKSRCKVVGKL